MFSRGRERSISRKTFVEIVDFAVVINNTDIKKLTLPSTCSTFLKMNLKWQFGNKSTISVIEVSCVLTGVTRIMQLVTKVKVANVGHFVGKE